MYDIKITSPDGVVERSIQYLSQGQDLLVQAFTFVEGMSAFVVIDHMDDIEAWSAEVRANEDLNKVGTFMSTVIGKNHSDGPIEAEITFAGTLNMIA